MARIEIKTSGIESHNALGFGERYHSYLRTIYRKVCAEHPDLNSENALSVAVHAMNNTSGPVGLAPTLLVFGIVPQMPTGLSDLPDQRERMKAMKKARDEMVKLAASSRLRTAVSRDVPAVATNELRVGMDVLYYRERPVNKWTGPFRIVAGDNKRVWIDDHGKLKQVSVDKLKEYNPSPDIAGLENLELTYVPSSQAELPTVMEDTFERRIEGEVFLTRLCDRVGNITRETEGGAEVEETLYPSASPKYYNRETPV